MDARNWKAEILVPLLSTVVGGVLALLGGILATTYQSGVAKEMDREKLGREKLERAYILFLQADEWAISELRQAVAVNISQEIDAPADTTLEAVMLVRLYSPELAERAVLIEKSRERYRTSIFRYYGALTAAVRSREENEVTARARPIVGRPAKKEFEDMGRAYEELHGEIAATLRELEAIFHREGL